MPANEPRGRAGAAASAWIWEDVSRAPQRVARCSRGRSPPSQAISSMMLQLTATGPRHRTYDSVADQGPGCASDNASQALSTPGLPREEHDDDARRDGREAK